MIDVAAIAIKENFHPGLHDFDGRFPAVSGLSFKFDPSLPKDSRVTEVIVGDRGPL